jgi:hypothetical protein
MATVLPRLLLAIGAVLCAYFIADGVMELLRADLETNAEDEAPREPARAERGPSAEPPVAEAATLLTRGAPVSDTATPTKTVAPTQETPAPKPAQQAETETAKSDTVQASTAQAAEEMGPCEVGLRVAGSAYLRPPAGDPVVMFSGPTARKGLLSTGSRVAGRHIAAIYPNGVVLRDSTGGDCWVKMSTAYAREVAGNERRASLRAEQKKQKAAQREKAAERRKARAAKKKKKKKR